VREVGRGIGIEET